MDVGTQHRTKKKKKHDEQWTNNENYKWLPVSLPKQITLDILRKPNIDAALCAPLSNDQSFYPSFSLSIDVSPFLSLSAFFHFCLFLPPFHVLSFCLSVLLPPTKLLCLWHFLSSLCWPDRCIQMEVKDSVMHYSSPSQEQEFGTMTGKLPLKQAICWDNKSSVKQVRGEKIQESSWHNPKWNRIIFFSESHLFNFQSYLRLLEGFKMHILRHSQHRTSLSMELPHLNITSTNCTDQITKIDTSEF